jgi:hypothetical protein
MMSSCSADLNKSAARPDITNCVQVFNQDEIAQQVTVYLYFRSDYHVMHIPGSLANDNVNCMVAHSPVLSIKWTSLQATLSWWITFQA